MRKILVILVLVSLAAKGFSQEFTTKFKCYFLKPDLDIALLNKVKLSDEMLIGKISKGKKVQMLEADTILFLFYKVNYKNTIGYIHKNALVGPHILDYVKQKHDSIARIRETAKRKRYTDSIMVELRKQDSVRVIQKRKAELEKATADRIKATDDSLKIAHEKRLLEEMEEKMKKEEAIMVRNGYPIKMTGIGISSIDSACGVSLYLSFKNIHPKTIKYIWLTGYIINAVGDRESCRITGKSTITARGIGPKKHGEIVEFGWGEVWYNCSAKEYIPTLLKIQYMDGSIITMGKDKINTITCDL